MRQIAMQREGWKARHYGGPNPHTDHVHASFFHRGTGARGLPEDIYGFGRSGRPYGFQGGEVVVPKGDTSSVVISGGLHFHVDPRSMKDVDDVVRMIKNLQTATRMRGATARTRVS